MLHHGNETGACAYLVLEIRSTPTHYGGHPLKSSNGCHETLSAVSPRRLIILRSGKVLRARNFEGYAVNIAPKNKPNV